MRLTAFTDYTLRVLMYLAVHRDGLVTIPRIAAAYGVSKNHLMKVVHALVRAGVVESVRGKGGGLRLAVPPEEIRLGAIVRASEGEQPIVECLAEDGGGDACRIVAVCRLQGALVAGFEALYRTLDGYTLADLAGNARPLRLALLGERARRA
ncbi:MAG: Rrf2 family transcriptional regulator [Deltaproteobacteria bacterium]|nr:Rrf2 family transcriptional regulator [Deltaproteobacteria bacterium]